MSWDAYACKRKIRWETSEWRLKYQDSEEKRLFGNAAKYVKRKTGSVDWLLRLGALDQTNCAYMLEKATGRSCHTYAGFRKRDIRRIAKEANWDFEYHPDSAADYWSARKFLEVCAKLNLSIEFSW